MTMLEGSFGAFSLIGGDLRVFDIYLEPMRQFFMDAAIKKTDMVGNELGLYSFLPVGSNGKALMTSLSTPSHLLQSRKNCLTWSPKGRMAFTPEEIGTFPIEFMGEQCADALFGNCLERVLANGNDIWDIFASEGGQALMTQAIQNVMLGLGNSFYDLVTFGGDSVLASSNTGAWWDTTSITTEEWADFVDQQGSGPTGHIPLIEAAKTAGLSNFTVDIPSGDVSGGSYTGSDVTALFDSCIAAAPAKFRVVLKQRSNFGAAILVSKGIFDAYKDYIITNFNEIPEVYSLRINGEIQRGVLQYDGLPVVCMDEWTLYDEMLGINSHRIVVTALGNLAIAHDIDPLPQFGGMGMRVEQSTRLRDKGITYMHTTFRVGAAIADTDFMVNASRILTP